ncbi:hypothetical protein HMPREF3203_02914, partial [Proteus mirabilis]
KPLSPQDEYNDTVNLALDYSLPQPQFTDPDIQAEAENWVALLDQIKESNDPNIHKQLKTPLHEAINKLSKADSERAVKNSVEDNKYYNSFIHQASQYQSYGILPRD